MRGSRWLAQLTKLAAHAPSLPQWMRPGERAGLSHEADHDRARARAGTGLDTVARAYGEKLAQSLGKPVVFDNRPGANGIVAVTPCGTMPADGHALLVGTSGRWRRNAMTYKHLPTIPKGLRAGVVVPEIAVRPRS
jgi:hypothetical protein